MADDQKFEDLSVSSGDSWSLIDDEHEIDSSDSKNCDLDATSENEFIKTAKESPADGAADSNCEKKAFTAVEVNSGVVVVQETDNCASAAAPEISKQPDAANLSVDIKPRGDPDFTEDADSFSSPLSSPDLASAKKSSVYGSADSSGGKKAFTTVELNSGVVAVQEADKSMAGAAAEISKQSDDADLSSGRIKSSTEEVPAAETSGEWEHVVITETQTSESHKSPEVQAPTAVKPSRPTAGTRRPPAPRPASSLSTSTVRPPSRRVPASPTTFVRPKASKPPVLRVRSATNSFDFRSLESLTEHSRNPPACLQELWNSRCATGQAFANPYTTNTWDNDHFLAMIAPKPMPQSVVELASAKMR